MTKHVMNILDTSGHTSVGWNPDNEAEVNIARAAFDDAIRRGYQAFHVREDATGQAKQGTRMREFDPTAEKMMLIPQLRGG